MVNQPSGVLLEIDTRDYSDVLKESTQDKAFSREEMELFFHHYRIESVTKEFPWATELLVDLGEKAAWKARHSLRVGVLAYTLARDPQNGISPEFVNELLIAGLVHDTGFADLGAFVRYSTSAFTDDDRERMKDHVGHSMRRIGKHASERIRSLVATHHHYIDNPYPPLDERAQARYLKPEYKQAQQLFALADQIDSLRSKRTYKEGFGVQKTADIIHSGPFQPQFLSSGIVNRANDLWSQNFSMNLATGK